LSITFCVNVENNNIKIIFIEILQSQYYNDEMKIFSEIIIFIFFAFVLNGLFLFRWLLFNRGKFPSKKIIILVNIILVLVWTAYYIFSMSDNKCKVDIIINNKNSNSEIIIDKNNVYYLTTNETVKINDLSPHGQIVIKTLDEAKLIIYLDDSHLFRFKHKIRVKINDNKIKIQSFQLSIKTIIEGLDKYDKILELIRMQNGI
jgi:hypothetical protein